MQTMIRQDRDEARIRKQTGIMIRQDRADPVFAPLDDAVFFATAKEVRRLIRARRAGLRLPLPAEIDTEGLQVGVWIEDKPEADSNPAVWRVHWQVDGTDSQRAAVAEAVHAYMAEL